MQLNEKSNIGIKERNLLRKLVMQQYNLMLRNINLI